MLRLLKKTPALRDPCYAGRMTDRPCADLEGEMWRLTAFNQDYVDFAHTTKEVYRALRVSTIYASRNLLQRITPTDLE